MKVKPEKKKTTKKKKPHIPSNFSQSKREQKTKKQEESLCMFFGAGASTLGGYRTFLTFPHMFWPTSKEPAILNATDKERVLLYAIRRELERKKKALTLDEYLRILNDYNTVLQNIFSDEELRSRFSDSLLFFSRIQELNQLVQRAKTHICALTVQHYREPPSKLYYDRMLSFYENIFKHYRHIQLFTTNYDIV